ncbi:MAG: cupin domain-containing protein [Pseudomonadota bacterium]
MTQPHAPVVHHVAAETPRDEPMAGLMRRRAAGERILVQDLEIAPGVGADMHHHEMEQLAVMIEGTMRFEVQDPDGSVRAFTAGPGDVVLLPANAPHKAVAETRCRLIDVFSPPAEKTGIDG